MLKTKLIQALAPTLSMNAARLKTLCCFIEGIIRHRTVNLTILATTHDGSTCSNQSRYRRFQDFFFTAHLDAVQVAQTILARLPKPPEGYLLAMDRTNWKFGQKHLNFLVVAVVVGNVSIPLFWQVLPTKIRQGNSNSKQRVQLITSLLKVLPAESIQALTMDREFVGKRWLTWLEQRDIPYVVRIKKNAIVGRLTAQQYAERKGRKLSTRRQVFGLDLFYSSKKISHGGQSDHLMVVSNRFSGKEALKLYRKRWGIERLFGHLKKQGFDLEATHMTVGYKLEKLFALVVLAFAYSYAWGCHLRHQEIKKDAYSKRKSLFRLGLEDLLQRLQLGGNQHRPPEKVKELYRWLQNPLFNSIFLV